MDESVFQSGDQQTAVFVELLTTHQRKLYGYIYTLVHNASDSDDLLQQTNLVLWQKHQEYEVGTNFMAWSCRIAFFNVQNFLKTKGRSRVCFNEEVLAKLAVLQVDRSDIQTIHSLALTHCIGNLSSTSQQLLKLCYDGNRSILDAAKQLGRPVGSLYTTLSRIRFKLWECIQYALMEEGSE
jgi:RNA polymerase sigma-70 factor, ECF subfamily